MTAVNGVDVSRVRMCGCGCGEPTPLAKKTDARKGWVKGEPVEYVAGHYGRTLKKGVVHFGTAVDAGEITESDIERLRGIDDLDAADVYDKRIRALERNTRRSFVEIGMICLEVSGRELWRKLCNPETGVYFHSFDAWVFSSLGVSRTQAYNAMKVLRGELQADDVREMPQCNAMRLAGLSTAVQRDPEIVQLAKEASEKEFIARVNGLHPDQHIEPKRAVLANPDESARKVIDQCFDTVRWAYDVESREDVMENLCAFFMDGMCEREGWTAMRNRDAFERAVFDQKHGRAGA